MTNPYISRVTNQVQKLRQKMTLTYAILAVSILAILKIWKNLNLSVNWEPNSLYVDHYERIFPMRKSIKSERKTVVLDWDLWEYMHGSFNEDIDTK